MGGAELRRLRIQNDVDGNLGHERGVPPFIKKRWHELTVRKARRHFRNDASADVDAAEGHDGQGEVSCLSAIHTEKQVHSFPAGWTQSVDSAFSHHRRRIFFAQSLLNDWRNLSVLIFSQKIENVD